MHLQHEEGGDGTHHTGTGSGSAAVDASGSTLVGGDGGVDGAVGDAGAGGRGSGGAVDGGSTSRVGGDGRGSRVDGCALNGRRVGGSSGRVSRDGGLDGDVAGDAAGVAGRSGGAAGVARGGSRAAGVGRGSGRAAGVAAGGDSDGDGHNGAAGGLRGVDGSGGVVDGDGGALGGVGLGGLRGPGVGLLRPGLAGVGLGAVGSPGVRLLRLAGVGLGSLRAVGLGGLAGVGLGGLGAVGLHGLAGLVDGNSGVVDRGGGVVDGSRGAADLLGAGGVRGIGRGGRGVRSRGRGTVAGDLTSQSGGGEKGDACELHCGRHAGAGAGRPVAPWEWVVQPRGQASSNTRRRENPHLQREWSASRCHRGPSHSSCDREASVCAVAALLSHSTPLPPLLKRWHVQQARCPFRWTACWTRRNRQTSAWIGRGGAHHAESSFPVSASFLSCPWQDPDHQHPPPPAQRAPIGEWRHDLLILCDALPLVTSSCAARAAGTSSQSRARVRQTLSGSPYSLCLAPPPPLGQQVTPR
ncbi:hypothetical protein FH972_026609 [Carpinus fangiana]|uniref:Uncharacterized protein n=1 Tax=Carpinus fangiana TaxID=176857 RepID=A0A5N6L4Y3_9ROSI|nr:hypothetical protein FH972_026609 [Carpinus fangiana]